MKFKFTQSNPLKQASTFTTIQPLTVPELTKARELQGSKELVSIEVRFGHCCRDRVFGKFKNCRVISTLSCGTLGDPYRNWYLSRGDNTNDEALDNPDSFFAEHPDIRHRVIPARGSIPGEVVVNPEIGEQLKKHGRCPRPACAACSSCPSRFPAGRRVRALLETYKATFKGWIYGNVDTEDHGMVIMVPRGIPNFRAETYEELTNHLGAIFGEPS